MFVGSALLGIALLRLVLIGFASLCQSALLLFARPSLVYHGMAFIDSTRLSFALLCFILLG